MHYSLQRSLCPVVTYPSLGSSGDRGDPLVRAPIILYYTRLYYTILD